jgi:serine/threonine-protein kinase
LRGKPLDGRSDIYALGMVSYEILTGELPFKNAKSTTEVIQFHLQESPPAPSSMNPDAGITLPVDELIQKMVAKHPEERHGNADDLRRHISDALKSMDRRAIRVEAKRLGLVIAALVLVLAGLIYFLRR